MSYTWYSGQVSMKTTGTEITQISFASQMVYLRQH